MSESPHNADRRPAAGYGRDRPFVTTLLAFLLAVLLHVGGYVALPLEIAQQTPEREREELELEWLPTPVPQQEPRFVEANPEVPENQPDPTPNYSFRDQQAADLNEAAEPSDMPDVGGEFDTQKVVQGMPEEPSPLPPGVYSSSTAEGEGGGDEGGTPGSPAVAQASEPPPSPKFLEEQPDADGEGSQVPVIGESDERLEAEEPSRTLQVTRAPEQAVPVTPGDGAGGEPDAKPLPRERPRLSPDLVRGELMQSSGSVARRGTVAIDATFSEFGEYQQQMLTAIQLGWWLEIDFFRPLERATWVHVRFTLKSNGEVADLEVVEATAGEVATVICTSAIEKRSPFRPWTKEMVDVFGTEQKLSIMFRYL